VAVTGHATVVTRDAVASAWTEKILSQLSGMKRGMYSVARVGDVADGVVTLYVPTKPHRDKCLESRDVVEAALVGAFDTPLTIEIVVDGESQAAPALSDAPVDEAIVHTEIIAEAEAIDLDDLVEAPRGAVDDFATSKIFEAFPGAVEEEA
jgi:hypothetical protein